MAAHSIPVQFRASLSPQILYVTAEGRDCVMDLQGSWQGRLLASKSPGFRVVCDSRLVRGPDWQCKDFALIELEPGAEKWAWAAWSSPFDLNLPTSELFRMEALEGQDFGWVMGSGVTVEINQDARALRLPNHYPPLAIPFWDGFRADRPVPFIQIPWRKELLFDSGPEGITLERASTPHREILLDQSGALREVFCTSILGRASAGFAVPTQAEALILRRTFDAFHGLQRARVRINGVHAAWWHQPFQERRARLCTDDLMVRLPELGGRSLKVDLEPPAGSPLFSLIRLEVYAAIPLRS